MDRYLDLRMIIASVASGSPIVTIGKVSKIQQRDALFMVRQCAGTVPCEGAQKYYKQRAVKGGLMLTEATTVNATGHGWVPL